MYTLNCVCYTSLYINIELENIRISSIKILKIQLFRVWTVNFFVDEFDEFLLLVSP